MLYAFVAMGFVLVSGSLILWSSFKRGGSWAATAQPTYYRAMKFLMLRRRYEMLAQRRRIEIAPQFAKLFAGVPDKSQFAQMCADAPKKPRPKDTDPYLARVKEAVTWADVNALEEAVIGLLSPAEALEQLQISRITYSQIVSPLEYATYAKQMMDVSVISATIDEQYAERLRAELLAVTLRIRYMIELSPPKERTRARLQTLTTWLMIAAMATIFAVYIVTSSSSERFVPTDSLFLVLFAGVVGGFVSVQQRLQEPTEVDPRFKRLELDASGLSLLLAPIIGMIFAAVLFVMFLAGLLSGNLFPSFLSCSDVAKVVAAAAIHCRQSDLASFAYGASPDSVGSWAKLGVWSFAAGFLERLVPDILTRIASVAQKA